ncbi:hypothetical protein ACM782_27480 [Pseudomonas aeruginosa]
MKEINKEAVEFWRKRGGIEQEKIKCVYSIYVELSRFDALTDMSFAEKYFDAEDGYTTEFLEKLSGEILDFTDCLDTDLDFNEDDRYSIELACENICSKLQHLSTIIEVEKVI